VPWTIFVVSIVLWVVGIATSYTLGGFTHILPVRRVVNVRIRIIQGRRAIARKTLGNESLSLRFSEVWHWRRSQLLVSSARRSA
jgi:hypothetical protein